MGRLNPWEPRRERLTICRFPSALMNINERELQDENLMSTNDPVSARRQHRWSISAQCCHTPLEKSQRHDLHAISTRAVFRIALIITTPVLIIFTYRIQRRMWITTRRIINTRRWFSAQLFLRRSDPRFIRFWDAFRSFRNVVRVLYDRRLKVLNFKI